MTTHASNWKSLLSTHRLCGEARNEISPARSPFQRDHDRIVFSGSFRRLQDKTQVFPLSKTDCVRTRLTHSLEASSIGRSLGTAAGAAICETSDTGGLHPSDIGAIVAAAALAHDIGNPPLGHAGEEAIQHWFTHSKIGQQMRAEMLAASRENEASDIEFFEGNAQGFRVLARLEMPDRPGGMRLTCATLAAFAKYPRGSLAAARSPKKGKFNFFHSERELFAEVAERAGMISDGAQSWRRHPLAYLVEAADDIAYRIVDFEDGHRLGFIDFNELENQFLAIIGAERRGRYSSVLSSMSDPRRKAEFLRTQTIGRLLDLCAKIFSASQPALLDGEFEGVLLDHLEASVRDALDAIAARSKTALYQERSVVEVIAAGFELISGMLDIFVPCVNELAFEAQGGAAASHRSKRLSALLPEPARDAADAAWRQSGYVRLQRILDYISGMTDSFAVDLFQKLKGISL